MEVFTPMCIFYTYYITRVTNHVIQTFHTVYFRNSTLLKGVEIKWAPSFEYASSLEYAPVKCTLHSELHAYQKRRLLILTRVYYIRERYEKNFYLMFEWEIQILPKAVKKVTMQCTKMKTHTRACYPGNVTKTNHFSQFQ